MNAALTEPFNVDLAANPSGEEPTASNLPDVAANGIDPIGIVISLAKETCQCRQRRGASIPAA
jgi:hypothetical protein